MGNFEVREKKNPLALHCITWSEERAKLWIEKNGDSGMFTDKTLNKDSFCIYKDGKPFPEK